MKIKLIIFDKRVRRTNTGRKDMPIPLPEFEMFSMFRNPLYC